jgi:hypothetical protein
MVVGLTSLSTAGRAPFPATTRHAGFSTSLASGERSKPLARYIEESGDGRCYGALGTDAGRLEDSEPLRLIVDKLIGDTITEADEIMQ